jgi:hypothetical protein
MSKLIAACTLLLVAAPCLADENVMILTPEALAKAKDTLLGKTVQVQGCIYIHHHGMQIGPCGEHDWHQITLADDPKDLLVDAFGPNQIPFGSLEAQFYGRVVNQEYDWPQHGFRPTLQIERISNVGRHEP